MKRKDGRERLTANCPLNSALGESSAPFLDPHTPVIEVFSQFGPVWLPTQEEEQAAVFELVDQGRIQCLFLDIATDTELQDAMIESERQRNNGNVLGTIFVNASSFRREQPTKNAFSGSKKALRWLREKVRSIFESQERQKNVSNVSDMGVAQEAHGGGEVIGEKDGPDTTQRYMKYPEQLTRDMPIPAPDRYCALRAYERYADLLARIARKRGRQHRCFCGKSRPQPWLGDVKHEAEYKYQKSVGDLLKKKERKLLHGLGLREEMKELDLYQADLLIRGREDLVLSPEPMQTGPPISRATDHVCPDRVVDRLNRNHCHCYPVKDLPDNNDNQVDDRVNLMADMLGKMRRYCKDRNSKLNEMAYQIEEENDLEQRVFQRVWT